jgi:mono/diheme cytochrome c family protein
MPPNCVSLDLKTGVIKSASGRRRLVFGLALAVIVVLLMAACGDDAPRAPDPGATATALVDSSLEKGRLLYAANCQVCHGDREGKGGSVASPHNEAGHTWHHPDAQLTEWVLNGRPIVAMPSFKDKLTEAEVDAILSYIKTWWRSDQRESQADISRSYQEALDKQRTQ